jgi:hypothetical protein
MSMLLFSREVMNQNCMPWEVAAGLSDYNSIWWLTLSIGYPRGSPPVPSPHPLLLLLLLTRAQKDQHCRAVGDFRLNIFVTILQKGTPKTEPYT